MCGIVSREYHVPMISTSTALNNSSAHLTVLSMCREMSSRISGALHDISFSFMQHRLVVGGILLHGVRAVIGEISIWPGKIAPMADWHGFFFCAAYNVFMIYK